MTSLMDLSYVTNDTTADMANSSGSDVSNGSISIQSTTESGYNLTLSDINNNSMSTQSSDIMNASLMWLNHSILDTNNPNSLSSDYSVLEHTTYQSIPEETSILRSTSVLTLIVVASLSAVLGIIYACLYYTKINPKAAKSYGSSEQHHNEFGGADDAGNNVQTHVFLFYAYKDSSAGND